MSLVHAAKRLALRQHAGQRRGNASDEPFTLHLAEVAGYVVDEGWPEPVVAVAWLHDVVEDTVTTLEQVRQAFGAEVAGLVGGLTDPVGFAGMPLRERKRRQAERIVGMPVEVRAVKLADQLSNARSVIDDPPIAWDPATCLAYLEGAARIAEACRGAAPRLGELMDRHRRRGMAKYGTAAGTEVKNS